MTGSPHNNLTKVGIIAGGGDLPIVLADACKEQGRPYLVIGLEGWAEKKVEDHPHVWNTLGKVGLTFRILKDAGCTSVVIAGYVKRPDFSQIKPDFQGAKLLPKVIKAARGGDDALLTTLVSAFEAEGFSVLGADDLLSDLVPKPGCLGQIKPTGEALEDIKLGIALLAATSSFDVGQAVVVCDRLVLAVEAIEGTDEVLQRCAALPAEIRGSPEARRGTLVKIPKHGQERRIDLPTIGIRTVELAAAAGLEGIAVAANGTLILNRAEVIDQANSSGLFVIAVDVQNFGDPSNSGDAM